MNVLLSCGTSDGVHTEAVDWYSRVGCGFVVIQFHATIYHFLSTQTIQSLPWLFSSSSSSKNVILVKSPYHCVLIHCLWLFRWSLLAEAANGYLILATQYVFDISFLFYSAHSNFTVIWMLRLFCLFHFFLVYMDAKDLITVTLIRLLICFPWFHSSADGVFPPSVNMQIVAVFV